MALMIIPKQCHDWCSLTFTQCDRAAQSRMETCCSSQNQQHIITSDEISCCCIHKHKRQYRLSPSVAAWRSNIWLEIRRESETQPCPQEIHGTPIDTSNSFWDCSHTPTAFNTQSLLQTAATAAQLTLVWWAGLWPPLTHCTALLLHRNQLLELLQGPHRSLRATYPAPLLILSAAVSSLRCPVIERTGNFDLRAVFQKNITARH